MSRCRAALALSLVAVWALPAPARAHGRPLGVNQFFRVDGRDVLFTTRGPVIEGADGSYRWSCSRAYGDSGQAFIPNLAYTVAGSLMAGTIAGLYRRAPGSCEWVRASDELAFMFVGDVFAPPSAGARVFAVTADPVSVNYIARSDDDGASFIALATGPARLQSVRVAPSDASFVYAAGFVPAEEIRDPPTGVLLYSADAGESFLSLSIPLEPGELSVVITHVSSVDPRVLWLRTVSARAPESPEERLLRVDTLVGEATEVLRRAQLRGSADASAPSGALWVIAQPEGDGGGLLRVSPEGDVAVRDPSLDASCVLEEAGQLYLCPIPRTGQTVALSLSGDGGQSSEAVLAFEDIRTSDGCPETENAGTCAADFTDIERDSEALRVTSPPPRTSGGCAAITARRGGSTGWLALVTAACALLRRRGGIRRAAPTSRG